MYDVIYIYNWIVVPNILVYVVNMRCMNWNIGKKSIFGKYENIDGLMNVRALYSINYTHADRCAVYDVSGFMWQIGFL